VAGELTVAGLRTVAGAHCCGCALRPPHPPIPTPPALSVTDGNDRDTLLSMLGSLYCPELFALGHPLSPSKEWAMPGADVREFKQYIDFVDAMPGIAAPEVFGLHENAAISRDQAEATKLFDSILLTFSSGGGGSGGGGKGKTKSKDDTVMELATDMLQRLHADFDLEAVGAQYPTDPKVRREAQRRPSRAQRAAHPTPIPARRSR